MRKHGYAAMDYIIISAVVLAAVIPFFFIAHEPLRSTPEANLQDALDSVEIAAQRLNRLAEDSADRVAVVIPQGVEGDPVIAGDGALRLRISGREYVYVFRNVVGRFPTNPGRQFVYLRKLRDKVYISPAPICGDGRIEGSEQCDYRNPALGPCHGNCNQNCRCSCDPITGCTGELGGYICINGECRPCQVDGDCNQAIGQSCINGRCTIPPEPTLNCCLPTVRCPSGNECNRETCTCVPSTGGCPPQLPNQCSASCPCPPRQFCNMGGLPNVCESCSNNCGSSFPPECLSCPLGETCSNGVCGPPPGCTSNVECDYPREVCDTTASPRVCRPCGLVGGSCDPNEDCQGAYPPNFGGVCGVCNRNSDCPNYPSPNEICDNYDKQCKPCYWAFNQCDYGQVCIDASCKNLLGGSYARQYGCSELTWTWPNGPFSSNPATMFPPPLTGPRWCYDDCPDGFVCMPDCRCKKLEEPPVCPGCPPRPGKGGPAPGPNVNPVPPTNCEFDPTHTIPPGPHNGNEQCQGSCPAPQVCVLTGSTSCTCQPQGTPNFFGLAPGEYPSTPTQVAQVEESLWYVSSMSAGPGTET